MGQVRLNHDQIRLDDICTSMTPPTSTIASSNDINDPTDREWTRMIESSLLDEVYATILDRSYLVHLRPESLPLENPRSTQT